MTTQPISAQSVRDYMALNSPGSTSQYTDATIGSNIRSAAAGLEKATQRWFLDRPATTWTTTTNGRPYSPITFTITRLSRCPSNSA